MKEAETIGDRIRKLRMERGLTQGQLAELVGVSRRQVNQWEQGRTQTPQGKNSERLATVLEVAEDYLLYGLQVPLTAFTPIDPEKALDEFYTTLELRFSFRVALGIQGEAERLEMTSGQFVAHMFESYMQKKKEAPHGEPEVERQDATESTCRESSVDLRGR
ncbi:MAG: helix-turn-helix domain-containing protein [Armatimonadota bacterium]